MRKWRWLCALALLTGCVDPDRAPRATDDAPADDGAADDDDDDDDDAAASTGGEEDPPVDEEAVLERAFNYETELIQANIMPEPGTHGDAATINYWAAPENLELFKSIDTTDEEQEVTFLEGSMFVKEHFNSDGDVRGFTVMYKGPPGYRPGAAGWFWARVSEGNVTHQGTVNFCVDCHVMNENTDYVIGVDADNQM